MQYGELVPQGKSNSSLEVLTFPWPWIVSGYNFNIMNTLHEFAATQPCSQAHPVLEKTYIIFQITISKLPKANKIYIE